MTKTKQGKSRLRWTTLVLLWVWAITVFTVVDLFLNVNEFDGIRPRANLYRGMRIAAHKMVGEPYYDDDFPGVGGAVRLVAVKRDPARRLADELAAVRTMKDPAALRERARDAADPRVRIAALETLKDREALLRAVRDEGEIFKVRRAAAKLLGRFGTEDDLDAIVGSKLPLAIRDGAVLGLGELGTASATERLLAMAAEGREAAVKALARISNAEAAPLLRQAVLDAKRTAAEREAICRALARAKDRATARALGDVLADTSNPPALRATAANSLGKLGQVEALTVVMAASTDAASQVARQARLATTRLKHIRSQ